MSSDRSPIPAALIEQLRELNRTLAAHSAATPDAVGAQDTAPVRTAVDGADEDARIDRLLERMDELVERLRAQPLAPAMAHRNSIAPYVRQRGERWGNVDDLLRQHAADPQLARRSVLFLTAREVVERFGIPTESGSGKGNMWMSYNRVDADGNVTSNLFFSFADGIVMFYEAEMQSPRSRGRTRRRGSQSSSDPGRPDPPRSAGGQRAFYRRSCRGFDCEAQRQARL